MAFAAGATKSEGQWGHIIRMGSCLRRVMNPIDTFEEKEKS
jgi:hypothetical protein